MTRRMLTITAVAAGLAVSGGVFASVVKSTDAVPAVAAGEEPAAVPVYERILVDDPVIRDEIRQLYAEDRALQAETVQKLDALRPKIAAERDWEARRVLLEEARMLKETLETRHVEIGLRIAELNGDTARIEDFSRALEEIRTADERRRATFADPQIEAERKQRMGY